MKTHTHALSLLVLLTAVSSVYAAVGDPLMNGAFDDSLDPWSPAPAQTDAVVHYDNAAVLLNPDDFPLDPLPFMDTSFAFLSQYPDPTGSVVEISSLAQEFSLPANADKLSFAVSMEILYQEFDGETDTFQAILYYGAGFSENLVLYKFTSTDVKYNVLEYLVDEDHFDGYANTRHCIYHTSVTSDVSSFAGEDVRLVLQLGHDRVDDTRTTVTLDDVAVSTTGDATPPTVEIGGMIELWPPNHKYRLFNLSDCVLSVGDDTDGSLNIDDVGNILSISSDEPEEVYGNGDGKTENDMLILSHSSFMVRAERQGNGNGRVYAVTFDVADGAGNISVATVYLGVPHDKSGKSPIVDDGPEAGYTIYP